MSSAQQPILGISAFFHDSAAAVLVDGRVVAAAQEERFSRVKHDAGFPEAAAEFCLRAAGVEARDLDLVVFYEKPLLRFDRLLETYLAAAPRGCRSFAAAMPSWLKHKLHVRREIRRALGRQYDGPIAFCEHHVSHAASAFYPSPFEDAAIITMDGVGEWATTTLGIGRGNQIELLRQIDFPDSIGLLYSAFTYHCGFRVNSGEYKLMGLAPFGKPQFVDLIRSELIEIRDDGSYRLNPDFFDFAVGLKMTSAKFDRLFGRQRRQSKDPIESFHQDMAASVQAVTEEVVIKTALHAREITGAKNLCMAGGVALNCVANGKLLRQGIFDEVWVQPASGDSGGALGAALVGWHQILKQPRSSVATRLPFNALLGPTYSDGEIVESLVEHGVEYEKLSDDDVARRIAVELAGGKVVARFCGAMEFGPRALGNRSILADPRGPDTQLHVNQKIKFRESFRPFAPAVLSNQFSRWFDAADQTTSPYMMFVHRVHSDMPSVPAVTHIDGTARVQTVDRTCYPDLESILTQFNALTGCPMLVNTSFNIRGEPIVCSPSDAIRCFLKTDIDVLAIENILVKKNGVPPKLIETSPRQSLRERIRSIVRVWNQSLSFVGLSVVYYVVVTPTAFLRRRRSEGASSALSFWKAVPPNGDAKTFERTF